MSNIIAIATQNAPYKLGLDEMLDFVYSMNEDATAKRKFGFLLRDKSICHKYAVIPDFQRNCITPFLYKTIVLCLNTGEKQATPKMDDFDEGVSQKGKRFAFFNEGRVSRIPVKCELSSLRPQFLNGIS